MTSLCDLLNISMYLNMYSFSLVSYKCTSKKRSKTVRMVHRILVFDHDEVPDINDVMHNPPPRALQRILTHLCDIIIEMIKD